ncbi:hypothetical protein PH235_08740 [Trichococcus sp. K1Tr]|uniref:hypothetical protein n=1 Tax=Trichococcus sp. K1Tr TaxID=3020847 RepID=UPI00232D2849|nr:hypothetical protein [Trichococcus sp. K1Tr]MDB6353644.1 hypothetical protein [Trichococcus sp. K1Tr]
MDQFDICMIHKMGTEIKGSGPIDGVNYKMDYSESKGAMEFDGWCIRIESTPCNYGGQRPWFICPYCEKRKRKLNWANHELICRSCLNYGYYCLNRTKTDYHYYYMMAKKICLKLDPHFEWEGGRIGCGVFPSKKKGMHWKTYQNLRNRYREYMDKGDRLISDRVGAIIRNSPFKR